MKTVLRKQLHPFVFIDNSRWLGDSWHFSCDEIIEGKLYHVKKGDVVVLPPNIVHGAYIGDEDVQVIDVFGEVRSDYMLKMAHTMADLNKKK